MTDFKVGDRVVYKATQSIRTKRLEGARGTVGYLEDSREIDRCVIVDWDDFQGDRIVLVDNVRLLEEVAENCDHQLALDNAFEEISSLDDKLVAVEIERDRLKLEVERLKGVIFKLVANGLE